VWVAKSAAGRCPPSAVLKGIAHRKLRLAEIHRWLAYLSSCSPCYREFTELQTEAGMTP